MYNWNYFHDQRSITQYMRDNNVGEIKSAALLYIAMIMASFELILFLISTTFVIFKCIVCLTGYSWNGVLKYWFHTVVRIANTCSSYHSTQLFDAYCTAAVLYTWTVHRNVKCALDLPRFVNFDMSLFSYSIIGSTLVWCPPPYFLAPVVRL